MTKVSAFRVKCLPLGRRGGQEELGLRSAELGEVAVVRPTLHYTLQAAALPSGVQ